jgi:polar amino acid transport system substrate-binding protein
MQRINKVRPIRKIIVCALSVMIILGVWSASWVFAASVKIATIAVPPFGMVVDGKNAGIYYDLANRLAEAAGLTYENKLIPVPRFEIELEEGTTDFLFSFPNETLNKVAINVTGIYTHEIIVLGKKGVTFNSLQDLHGKQVAELIGSVMSEAVEADKAIRIVGIRTYVQGVKMLLAGHVDAILGTKTGLYYAIQQMGNSLAEFGEPLVLQTNQVDVFFSKKTANEEVIAALKSAAERLIQENVIQQIDANYIKSK